MFYSNTHENHKRFQPVADLHHEFVPNPGAYRVVPVENFQENKEAKMGPIVESVTISGIEPFKINYFFTLIQEISQEMMIFLNGYGWSKVRTLLFEGSS